MAANKVLISVTGTCSDIYTLILDDLLFYTSVYLTLFFSFFPSLSPLSRLSFLSSFIFFEEQVEQI
jgi:hypothetical protein